MLCAAAPVECSGDALISWLQLRCLPQRLNGLIKVAQLLMRNTPAAHAATPAAAIKQPSFTFCACTAMPVY
jgi:hypothetical protein